MNNLVYPYCAIGISSPHQLLHSTALIPEANHTTQGPPHHANRLRPTDRPTRPNTAQILTDISSHLPFSCFLPVAAASETVVSNGSSSTVEALLAILTC